MPRIFSFDDYALDLRRGCLCVGDREIKLRPKSFEVLRHLVENGGRLVSKDELFDAVWPDVSVTDESLSRCVSDVRLALGDCDQRIIKTVPRRGYLFAATVLARDADGGTVLTAAGQQALPAPSTGPAVEPPRLSLIVLPFVNLSGDPTQDYVADIITEGLTTHLSRIRDSFVIARTTAMTYKGKAVDVRRVAEEVGVRYVLEGSAQRRGSRLRANAQLVDAASGAHIWADQFDADRAELFQMQDEIVTSLARALQIELAVVAGARISRTNPSSTDAEALALRAEAIFLRHGVTRDATDEGYALCDRALQIDPCNVLALSILVEKFTYQVIGLQTLDRKADLRRADELVSRALAIDPNSYHARKAKAAILVAQRRFEEAILEAERSLALYPSFIPAYLVLGSANLVLGRAQKMIECAEEANRLSPRDPYRGLFWAFQGYGHIMLHDDDRAITCFRRAIFENPDYPIVYARLAAALALKGKEVEARAMLDRYLAHPRTKTKTISQLKAATTESDSPLVIDFRARLYEGLSKLGMPES